MTNEELRLKIRHLEEELDLVKSQRDKYFDILNTPYINDFASAVVTEAAHQRFRWGNEINKKDEEWFWTVAYLCSKSLMNPTDLFNTDSQEELKGKLSKVFKEAGKLFSEDQDNKKKRSNSEWFWTLGHLAYKELMGPTAFKRKTRKSTEKRLHRIIAAAACLCNWWYYTIKREEDKWTTKQVTSED